MISYIPPGALRSLVEGRVNYLDGYTYAMLLRPDYVPDDSHQFVSDVQEFETSGDGYYQEMLTGKTVDWVDGALVLRCNPVAFTGTFTFQHLVIYSSTGDPATSALLTRVDQEQTIELTDHTFLYTAPTGILQLNGL